MSMPADFVSLILTSSDVVGLIGDRIYPQVVPPQAWSDPQNSRRPCLVYRTITAGRNRTFCATDGLAREMYQFDCYAVSYDAAKQLGEALFAAIIDRHVVSGSTQIDGVSFDNEFDLMDPDPGLYRRVLTFTVWHRSSADV